MENLFDFEGGSVAYGVFTASTDQKDELTTSLTSFVRLYGQRRNTLQRASESFALAAARLHYKCEDVAEAADFLFSVFGGVLGATCGAVTGGVGGALGAVSAATCTKFCGHINALGATFGFVGSVLGGVVGGTFCGGVGGAVCAAAKATGDPAYSVVSDVAWFTIGGATGGAIGGIFGGTVGAAGGAVGGAFGALCATRFAVFLVGNFCRTLDSKDEKTKSMKVKMMQESGHFSETIKPLVDELKTIQTVSDKMACGASGASGAAVRDVAEQTAKTLTSVTAMEKSISDSQRASDLLQFVSSVEEAARQSRTITEDLETTRAEVETYLVSTRKL